MNSRDTACPAPGLSIHILHAIVFFALIMLLFPAAGFPGQWQVSPARISLDRGTKSSVITVVNEGEERINLQGKAMEWSQDSDGKDVYKETSDLVLFPRILMINKGEQKIIRTGTKIPATSGEKTYRLFIEEIPQPKKAATDSAQLTVAVRFGVPVFVKPIKEELTGELAATELAKGMLNATVKNTGNTHFRISEISLKGKNEKNEETFSTKLDGWYLLAGSARIYSIPIPAGKCAITTQLDLSVSTDTKITLNRRLNVEKRQCLP